MHGRGGHPSETDGDVGRAVVPAARPASQIDDPPIPAYLASARIAFSSPSSVSGYMRSSTSSRTIPTEAE
jgi:ABC-type phosphate/phosphonate transport system substrate-binding protein